MRFTDETARVRRFCRTLVHTVILALAAVGCVNAPPAKPRIDVRVATGLPGMTFKPLGQALIEAYRSVLPDVRFSIIETAGSVENLQHLENGTAEIGLALADASYLAYNGHIPELAGQSRRLRGMAVLHPSLVHVLIPRGSGVRSISDLHGRLGVGPAGSGTALTAALLLRAFGVPLDAVQNSTVPFINAADALVRGELAATFVVAADPVEAVRRATEAGARLLNVSGPVLQQLQRDYPFLRPAVIPGGTYMGELQAISTVEVDVLLVCRADLDEQLIRRLTASLFQVLPQLARTNQYLRLLSVERAPATPIPLHSGAALYYRERELSR